LDLSYDDVRVPLTFNNSPRQRESRQVRANRPRSTRSPVLLDNGYSPVTGHEPTPVLFFAWYCIAQRKKETAKTKADREALF